MPKLSVRNGLRHGIIFGVLSPTVALASGFAIMEQGASTQGTSFAGMTTDIENTTTMFHNPAALGGFRQGQVDTGTSYIRPSIEFTNPTAGSSTPPMSGGYQTLPASGVSGSQKTDYSVTVPYFSAAIPLNGRWAGGITVNAPWGMKTKYEGGWVGRYHALESSLSSTNITPMISYKPVRSVTLAFGPQIQQLRAQISNAVDFGGVGLAALHQLQNNPSFAGSDYDSLFTQLADYETGLIDDPTVPGNSGLAGGVNRGNADGLAKLKGSGWGVGAVLGAMWQMDPETRLGASYRSAVAHTLKGDATFTGDKKGIYDGLQTGAGQDVLGAMGGVTFKNSKASVNIRTPDQINVGIYRELGPQFAVMGDVKWTNWSVFKQLAVQFKDGQPTSVTTQKWKDTVMVAVGGTYKPSEDWVLRAGYAFDQSPVREEHRTPRIPDSDRHFLSMGATYKVNPQLAVSAAYSHVMFENSKIRQSSTVPENSGRGYIGLDTKGHSDILSVSASYRF